MRREEIDEALRRHGETSHEVSAALLEQIAESIRPTLRPVHSLPSTRILSGVLIVSCAAVAIIGAAHAGLYGFERLRLTERVFVFSMLGVLAWVASNELVCELVPGSRHRFTPSRLVALVVVALLCVFAVVFHEYRATHFVKAGLACLAAGVAYAIPAALLALVALRRGFAVNLGSAGFTAGTVGGIAGVTFLELHCPLFEAPHVLVWHTAVVAVSAVIGAAIGMAWDTFIVVVGRRETARARERIGARPGK